MKLWKNGVFHTMIEKEQIHHAMATHQGKIIGFDDDLLGMSFDETIDMFGCHVYPGFVDAHLHLLGYGQMLSRISLKGKSKNEVLMTLNSHFTGKLLYAEQYTECGISKDDLNEISSTTPIYLRHNDYHSLTVNDAVLSKMNVKSETGILTEEIAQQAIDLFPKFTSQELILFLKNALNHLYSYGVTGGHSDDLYYFNGFEETVKVFETVLVAMPFRTHLLMHHRTLQDYEASKKPWLDQSAFLQLGAVKLFYDGTISSKTALMYHPYQNTTHHGLRVETPEKFISLIRYARSLGLPVAVHVIGDQGLDELIKILKDYPPKSGLIDRLIHTPYMRKETVALLKGMPLSIDIQPQFLSSDLPWALDHFTKIPELCFPWKSLLETGIILSGSSDAPVEIPNPLLGMHAAIFRRSSHDQNIYFSEESLSRFDAIKLYTTTSQIQSLKSNRGLLKPGYIADMTVTKANLLTMEEPQFFEDQIEMTVIDEQIVYRRLHKI
jgi:predicted amidohydrolase YtcJ